jgi:hypothetical protein
MVRLKQGCQVCCEWAHLIIDQPSNLGVTKRLPHPRTEFDEDVNMHLHQQTQIRKSETTNK